jgi:Dolichyl-phosphate-mannose-protein mannosyltransferase
LNRLLTSPQINSKSNASLLLLGIPLVLSAFTHIWNPLGFPHIYIDEAHYMRRAMLLLKGLGPQEPTDAYTMQYDHPYFGQLFLAGILALTGYPSSVHPSPTGDESTIERLWLVPRLIMGTLAVVDTFLIYKIAERIHSRNVAMIASILFAVMPFTWFLRRIQLESILLPFLLSSILFAVYYRYAEADSKNMDKTKRYSSRKSVLLILLSGGFLGTAIFTKIPAFTMMPLVALLILAADRNSNNYSDKHHSKQVISHLIKRLKPLVIWLIPVILIPLIWPAYIVLTGQFDNWSHGITGWSRALGTREMMISINQIFSVDPVMTIMGIAGLVLAAIKRHFFVLMGVIPFFIYFELVGFVKYYYWDLVFPLFCIASAILIVDVSKKVSSNKIVMQRMSPFVIISVIGTFGLLSTTMLITINVNSAYFNINSLIVQSLQYLSNSDNTHHSNYYNIPTMVGTDYVGGFSWIPKYILGIDHQFVKFSKPYLNKPLTSKNVLLVLDKDSISSISDNKKGNENDVLHLVHDSKNMGTFDSKNRGTFMEGNFSSHNTKEYPYTSIEESRELTPTAKVEVRTGTYVNTGFKINATGNFGSLQNDQTGKPAWIVVGSWKMNVSEGAMNVTNPNPTPNSAAFNTTLWMVKLDGTSRHKHTISNFKLMSSSVNEHTISNFKLMSSSVNKKNISATFNGTATITMREGPPVKDVPISIKFGDSGAASVWVDPVKTQRHFGNTPIYSFVSKTG